MSENFEDVGDIEFDGCDDANIPVNCFIAEPGEDCFIDGPVCDKWRWFAGLNKTQEP